VSPNSTARHRTTVRKIALCAAALIVTVLPTACGAAYADPEIGHAGHQSSSADGSDVVEVGGTDAADSESDSDDPAADTPGEDAGQGDADTGGQAGNGEEPAPEEEGGNGTRGDGARGDGARNAERDAAERAAADRENAARDRNAPREQNPPNEDAEQAAADDANAGGGLDVLGTDCTNSELEPHDGFQEAPRCVSTSFGEVASEDKSPSLLITEAPQAVPAQQEFTISVSTRNLVRDRFLGAAAGGYYKESSFLDGSGLQRGHFHTACRMLESLDTAPDAAPEPEFFLATQDNRGGAEADTVKITVDGMPERGTAQCAVWAGDGSHRLPMMQRANQTPAFDVVRITVE
jgi:hypothetical protein